mgnify:CR=1 FL=1
MKNKKVILHIILILAIVIVVSFLSTKITELCFSIYGDRDYQALGLNFDSHDIVYYTVYNQDIFDEYKVYKISDYYKNENVNEIKEKLENSSEWSKEKFYEYIMMKFYERIDGKITEIDREDLYYYNKGLIYAIIDVKNSKLYYLKNNIIDYHNDYDEILGIKLNNYTNKEIYNIKGQDAQNDGIDYYTYNFNEEKGKDIEEFLNKSQNWSKEKLDNDILDCFEYNNEIFDIQNGYYCYKKVYKTNNSYKNVNTDRKEDGYEVGVYDCDKDILYYYWLSH